MHIGLIGSIAPAAPDFYYRSLVKKSMSKHINLDKTIFHAGATTLVRNLMNDNKDVQVVIYEGLTQRLKNAGADCVAITLIAGYFCIERFKETSALPVVDMLSCIQKEVSKRGYGKIGILGTKPIMESKFYSSITSTEINLTEGNLLEEVHKAYVEMATSDSATDEQKQVLETACNQLINKNKVDAVMLGGTDLALVYNSDNVDFELIDCEEIHVAELFNIRKD